MGGRMDGRTDGRMGGRVDGWMDGWVDGRMDGWMDASCIFQRASIQRAMAAQYSIYHKMWHGDGGGRENRGEMMSKSLYLEQRRAVQRLKTEGRKAT